MYLLKRNFWSLTRVIRLVIGIVAVGEAVNSGQLVFYLIGGVLLVQSLLVKQDCSYHCATIQKEVDQNKEIEFEEIKE